MVVTEKELIGTATASSVLRSVSRDRLTPFTIRDEEGNMCALGVLYDYGSGDWSSLNPENFDESIGKDESIDVADAISSAWDLTLYDLEIIEETFDGRVNSLVSKLPVQEMSSQDIFKSLPQYVRNTVMDQAANECAEYLESIGK